MAIHQKLDAAIQKQRDEMEKLLGKKNAPETESTDSEEEKDSNK